MSGEKSKKSGKRVRIFSTPTCPHCHLLMDFLKEHKIDFEDIDVSQDEKSLDEMIEKSGQMGVPVVQIGDKIVLGFDRAKIVKLLDIKD